MAVFFNNPLANLSEEQKKSLGKAYTAAFERLQEGSKALDLRPLRATEPETPKLPADEEVLLLARDRKAMYLELAKNPSFPIFARQEYFNLAACFSLAVKELEARTKKPQDPFSPHVK